MLVSTHAQGVVEHGVFSGLDMDRAGSLGRALPRQRLNVVLIGRDIDFNNDIHSLLFFEVVNLDAEVLVLPRGNLLSRRRAECPA